MSDPLVINGPQPDLEGHVCEEMLAEEYWHAGKMTIPANVVHLRFSGSWYRLYFDGAIFWRESREGPEPYEMPELHSEVRIIDLGALYDVRGRLLKRIETHAIAGGSEVVFHFAESRKVCFRDVYDITSHAV